MLIINDDEVKQYHRKRLLELSLKSIGEIPQLADPDKDWVKRRMKASKQAWEVYHQK